MSVKLGYGPVHGGTRDTGSLSMGMAHGGTRETVSLKHGHTRVPLFPYYNSPRVGVYFRGWVQSGKGVLSGHT